MNAVDPDTAQVYYFNEGDVGRELARRYTTLDSTVSNPEWMMPTEPEVERDAMLPPARSDYALGEEGQAWYRAEREQWYSAHTGCRLTGTLAEQNDTWDNLMRNYRVRSDR